jgi:hypothetical protein
MGRHGSANMPPRKNFLSCSPEVYSGVTSYSGNADHNVGQCSSADRALVSPHVMVRRERRTPTRGNQSGPLLICGVSVLASGL